MLPEPLYTVLPLQPGAEPIAPALSLEDAFARIMALTERHHAFCRTGRKMWLWLSDTALGEPQFESDLPTDIYARRAIKAQVIEHGLGRYRVVAHEEQVETNEVLYERAL